MNWDELFSESQAERAAVEALLRPIAAGDRASGQREERYVSTGDGEIRVLHHRPGRPEGRRPLVFLPGWGALVQGFGDFLHAVDGRSEYYYVETREKGSSRLDRRRARMDMDRCAEDVRAVLEETGLAGGDYVLMGTCWGSTIIAHGLARGILSAPTTVLYDPMHRLWFPDWLLRTLVPAVPIGIWRLLKPAAKAVALWGMQEETQKQRTALFIDCADLWKWRRTALQVRETNLYNIAPEIPDEVFVLNGASDKIHDQSHYPRLAAGMPRGRFFYLPVDESQRELLMGWIALQFSKVRAEQTPPEPVRRFEKDIR